MRTFQIDGIEIVTDVEDLTRLELKICLDIGYGKGGSELAKLEIHEGPDNTLEVNYICRRVKFERIRRITGYLVGTIDRWNDAKRAEAQDRVKHIGKR